MVSPFTQNRDLAFRIIASLTDEDVQTEMSKQGRTTILKNPEIFKLYGSEIESLKGKNLENLFMVKPRVPHEITRYDGVVGPIINKYADKVALEMMDINTALRKAQEEADKAIADAKAGD
jgi:multiple sugar transport system substrate-binding protein